MGQRKRAALMLLAAVTLFAAGCGKDESKVTLGTVIVAKDGKSSAHTVKSGSSQYVVENDKQVGEKYDRVWWPAFNDDGSSLAFMAASGGKQRVVRIGRGRQQQGADDEPTTPAHSRRPALASPQPC